ncbi:hypothetical protein [Streptomyces griseocarneus]|uniref:hypothetical protein n=1 Tax=Streptomyces griseocarneus TaxID=51201 RepID=UPI00167E629A|nr:hypothetical protein [Streptomyces griseocarneus]MBZ6473325.1 hypothetical protein [Streptomyces griseocarneus]GHG57568.1 hypothetical protein GCM10018779_22710 [Streptomyces griseocarneus]
MILWEALGSVLIGLAVSYGALRWLPPRYGHFRSRTLALSTGPVAALFGALLTHSVLGPGHTLATLGVSLGVAVALLSLLLRPAARARRSATA